MRSQRKENHKMMIPQSQGNVQGYQSLYKIKMLPSLELEDINKYVPQFGAGKVEPEKEKNPHPEYAGRAQEQDVGLDSPPVLLPEEQNPEPLELENNDYQDMCAFNERLFSRQYKHRGSNDILQAGATLFMVYKCKLLTTILRGRKNIKMYISTAKIEYCFLLKSLRKTMRKHWI